MLACEFLPLKLQQFQSTFFEITGFGSVIHVYDCLDVNDTFALPPYDLLTNYGYHKFKLFGSCDLSAFLFYPINECGITCFHSHHTSHAITSTFNCNELSLNQIH